MALNSSVAREAMEMEKEIAFFVKSKYRNMFMFAEIHEDSLHHQYLSLEYCEGGDLEQFITNQHGNPLEAIQLKRLFYQISRAVQFLHNLRIIHRDIKPKNIVLNRRQFAKVIDFGLSVKLSPGEKCSGVVGSLGYMAPEMLRGDSYDYSVDIWSLGCVFGQMVTLKPIFTFTGDCLELNNKIMNGEYTPMPQNSELTELVDLTHSMLKNEPSERPDILHVYNCLEKVYIKRFAVDMNATTEEWVMKDERLFSHEETMNVYEHFHRFHDLVFMNVDENGEVSISVDRDMMWVIIPIHAGGVNMRIVLYIFNACLNVQAQLCHEEGNSELSLIHRRIEFLLETPVENERRTYRVLTDFTLLHGFIHSLAMIYEWNMAFIPRDATIQIGIHEDSRNCLPSVFDNPVSCFSQSDIDNFRKEILVEYILFPHPSGCYTIPLENIIREDSTMIARLLLPDELHRHIVNIYCLKEGNQTLAIHFSPNVSSPCNTKEGIKCTFMNIEIWNESQLIWTRSQTVTFQRPLVTIKCSSLAWSDYQILPTIKVYLSKPWVLQYPSLEDVSGQYHFNWNTFPIRYFERSGNSHNGIHEARFLLSTKSGSCPMTWQFSWNESQPLVELYLSVNDEQSSIQDCIQSSGLTNLLLQITLESAHQSKVIQDFVSVPMLMIGSHKIEIPWKIDHSLELPTMKVFFSDSENKLERQSEHSPMVFSEEFMKTAEDIMKYLFPFTNDDDSPRALLDAAAALLAYENGDSETLDLEKFAALNQTVETSQAAANAVSDVIWANVSGEYTMRWDHHRYRAYWQSQWRECTDVYLTYSLMLQKLILHFMDIALCRVHCDSQMQLHLIAKLRNSTQVITEEHIVNVYATLDMGNGVCVSTNGACRLSGQEFRRVLEFGKFDEWDPNLLPVLKLRIDYDTVTESDPLPSIQQHPNLIIQHEDISTHIIKCNWPMYGQPVCYGLSYPLTPAANYFEVKILSLYNDSVSSVGVGVGSYKYNGANIMPGWMIESRGYHSDDGSLFCASGTGTQFGPICQEGDIIGCGIKFPSVDQDVEAQLFYLHNGKLIGHLISLNNDMTDSSTWNPLIGLIQMTTKVKIKMPWQKNLDFSV